MEKKGKMQMLRETLPSYEFDCVNKTSLKEL